MSNALLLYNHFFFIISICSISTEHNKFIVFFVLTVSSHVDIKFSAHDTLLEYHSIGMLNKTKGSKQDIKNRLR